MRSLGGRGRGLTFLSFRVGDLDLAPSPALGSAIVPIKVAEWTNQDQVFQPRTSSDALLFEAASAVKFRLALTFVFTEFDTRHMNDSEASSCSSAKHVASALSIRVRYLSAWPHSSSDNTFIKTATTFEAQAQVRDSFLALHMTGMAFLGATQTC